jgi:hypothetical protein
MLARLKIKEGFTKYAETVFFQEGKGVRDHYWVQVQ